MRHFESPNLPIGNELASLRSGVDVSNAGFLLSIARRRKYLVLAGLTAGVVVGAMYYINAKPKFSAASYIMLNGKTADDFDKDTQAVAPTVDTAELDSQVEVIKSRAVAEVMIKTLDPEDREQLARELTTPKFHLPFFSATTGPAHGTGADALDPELALRALYVNRMDRTYVVEIAYTAHSAALAASVANGFTEAFQSVLADRRLASVKRKIAWIEKRIEEARAASVQADAALQGFRLSQEVGASDAAKRELELKTENYRKLYQSLLERRQRALDEVTFPRDEFRVISPAQPPELRTSPRLSFVAAISLLAGGGGGAILAALLEMTDNTFRTTSQVEELLRARFLGWLPLIRKRRRRWRASREDAAEADPSAQKFPEVLRYSTDHTRSRYAETIRAIRASVGLIPPRDAPKVIGIVSALPGEGKSTLSINLGRLLAREGMRVLVVDGDLRNRDASKTMASSATTGLYQALGDGHRRPPLSDLLVTDATSGMRLLAVTDPSAGSRDWHNHLVARFEALMSEARTMFEIIIVDLPPLAAVADARTMSALCDSFVLVIEWGKTNRGAVCKFVDSERGVRERLLGVVFNKVDLDKLKQYEREDDPQYHPYRRYFSDSDAASV